MGPVIASNINLDAKLTVFFSMKIRAFLTGKMVSFCVKISTQNDVTVCPVFASNINSDAKFNRFLYFFYEK